MVAPETPPLKVTSMYGRACSVCALIETPFSGLARRMLGTGGGAGSPGGSLKRKNCCVDAWFVFPFASEKEPPRNWTPIVLYGSFASTTAGTRNVPVNV